MKSDRIFDIGMHRGEGTRFYLAKGFRVVAVEANRASSAPSCLGNGFPPTRLDLPAGGPRSAT